LTALLLAPLLTTCASHGPWKNDVDRRLPAVEQRTEEQDERVRRLENRLEQLEIELQQAQAKRAAAERAAAECREEIARLEEQAAAPRDTTPPTPSEDPRIGNLENRVRVLEADQLRHDGEVTRKEKQIRELEVDVKTLTKTLESRAASLEVDEDTEYTKVTLFYGTNRAHAGEWKPDFGWLLAPAILLIAFFVLPLGLARVLKPQFQRMFVIGTRVICGVLVVALVFIGATGMLEEWRDRQAAAPDDSSETALVVNYSGERRPGRGGEYELGTCTVTIPKDHSEGVIEGPTIFELHRDPTRHFTLKDIVPLESRVFFDGLKTEMEQQKKRQEDSNAMFIFVHGYHNTFQHAAFRTAQIFHDLNFAGAPVFFSWPSERANYLASENNVGLAEEALRGFLEEILANSEADKIYLLAHSMGSRVLTQALKGMSPGQLETGRFTELVLAAPDIDADTFGSVARSLESKADRVTLYISSHDRALKLSEWIHGDYRRAGMAPPIPGALVPGVDTIDVSRVSSGHSYVSDNGRVLDDLKRLLTGYEPPIEIDTSIAERIRVDGERSYWILRNAPMEEFESR
jgi:esterase/lipase superfamily enzyme